MPFRELGRLEQRLARLGDYDTGAFSLSELCRAYGLSRETFYVWLRRRAAGPADWFVDRSHAREQSPHRTADEVVEAVIGAKRRFPRFGPKKLKAWLERHHPQASWPAASTIGDMLKRAGLVEARAGPRRAVERGGVELAALEPNAEWACDFKGWFRTRDGQRCDPLTITDTASRYLIDVRIAEASVAGVQPIFARVFEEHGLPQAIRCDTGSPFGSSGAGGAPRVFGWLVEARGGAPLLPPAPPPE